MVIELAKLYDSPNTPTALSHERVNPGLTKYADKNDPTQLSNDNVLKIQTSFTYS